LFFSSSRRKVKVSLQKPPKKVDGGHFQRVQPVALAQPGGAVVEQAVTVGRRAAEGGAVVEQGVALAHLLTPRQEAARVAQVQHRGRQPQAGAGDRRPRPEVGQHLGRVARLPQPPHPQRQFLAVGRPVERRPLGAGRVGDGQGGAETSPVPRRQRRLDLLGRLLQGPAALLEAPPQRHARALLADDRLQVDAGPRRLQPPRPGPQVAPRHQGGQRQEVIDVQPGQRLLLGSDVGVRQEDAGVDLGGPRVRRPTRQPQAAQPDDGRRRPAGVAPRIEPLEERRPERGAEPGDVVRPVGAQAALGLLR
jgi:hypothetical protein